ncbi:nucleoside diphosphate-linked moiety X motif 19-like isoform X2 [Patiria miniata]|nr:nucleoside diphosphate-linked moiety X motif 19-like isoform X2 [Patiria miniata]XP_038052564.1 nucleoside diphosphate-linked moiety X motif 19-like isoform X2 [Patiria miniata]XP_038052565.1 nucleoside diphosphate-linked moiety X motif 19-like isoform X2 [Patiria miniata]XP_038052566.1 nucleoside diphosphate-linked moiety X motif 19-like isoform X2 [Patiria miniata]XP_038052567.1 nucleoside diphosphate-linked moiety X motif 19-like isoform X2 [Patiria miniata]
MKYWKEAATVILAARFRNPGSICHPAPSAASRKPTEQEHSTTTGLVNACFDYKVLMLQRTHHSSFFAGAQVFPGGGIDEADYSPKWMELFAEVGIRIPQDFGPMVSKQHERPPMIAADRGSPVPSDIAFRICAIRETFEESGVLLLKQFSHCHPATDSMPSVQQNNSSSTPDISVETSKEWRHRVHNNAAEFLEMCRELRSLPDVWSLAEWSDWLTPSDMRRKRYDTMFYLCCMDTQPSALHDDKETIQLQWVTPSQSLAQYSEGEFFLPPPQVYEFQRLCRFPKLSALFNFSQQRALLGCQRYLPVRMNCSNGVITTLPGDHLYPDPLILQTIQDELIPQIEGTIEENTDTSKPLHRQMFALSTVPMCQAMCSFTLPYGHCAPLPYQECVDLHSQSSKL